MEDDTTFWIDRFKEHAAFLYILLTPQFANDLKEQVFDLINDFDLERLFNLQMEVLGRNNAQMMLTEEDFEALVYHMIEEQNFYKKLMNGQMTDGEEVNFWLNEASEHTELASHMLELGQLRDEVLDTSKELLQAEPDDILRVYEKSNKFAKDLDGMLREEIHDTDVIKALMVEHEMKEATRGEQRLKVLLANL